MEKDARRIATPQIRRAGRSRYNISKFNRQSERMVLKLKSLQIEGSKEEKMAADLVTAVIKQVESIRQEMKQDEKEIAQIQRATQRLLEKIEAA